MYSNSKHCHLLPWVGIVFLYPTAISAYGLLRRGSSTPESQMQTLCFDLSKVEHGQYGSRTMQASNANAPWLLDFDEVTEGPCKDIEEEEVLSGRQIKQVSYCKHFGTSIDIIEYQLDAPRYLERFLYDVGATRGECMNADAELDSDDSMVSLCFNLDEYGQQTVVVDKKSSKWFLSNDGRVVKGECRQIGQKLDRREAELVTYCKHFGSPSDGYEYEIEAPEFMSDYLYTSKGIQRGECPSLDAGLVLCHVPGDLAIETGTARSNAMSRRDLRKKTRGRKKQNCNCSACEKKIGSGELLKEKKQDKKPSSNKDKPKIGQSMIGKNSNKNKPRPRPQPKPSQQGMDVGSQNTTKPTPKPSKKPTPKPNGQKNMKPTPKPSMKPTPKPNGQKNTKPTPRPTKNTQQKLQQPTWEQPTWEQPTWEQPTWEQPTWQQPTWEQPTWQQPTWDQDQQQWQQPNTSWQQQQANGQRSSCNDCICKNIPPMGLVHKPGTNCQQYVQCNDGCIVHNLSCGSSGLIFDSNLQVCQWASAGAVCRPDPQGC